MDLNNFQRLYKLIANLSVNPDLIPPYLKMSVFSRKSPIELNMPWWSFRAIERADSIIQDKKVFEFGTGGSTVRYAEKAQSITCVEDNFLWLEIVKNALNQKAIKNVELIYSPFDFDHPVSFGESKYLHALAKNDHYDIVIIDGQDKTFRERIKCFEYVEPIMKDACIILDDFWRYTELLQRNRANTVEVYESVGPSRIGVTSTAFFFYGKSYVNIK